MDLTAYENEGESELASSKLGKFIKVRYGSISESKKFLGEIAEVREAYLDMQRQLYTD